MEHQHHFRGHGLLRRQKGAGEGPDAAEGFHPGDLRGATLDDGRLAEQNYVWLSDWQLENVNHNYQMPVDFESYKKLKNNIAKILAPLLQIWLYATRKKGVFEKRYDEICQLLDTAEYRHASKIREKIGPSLEELKEHGYLASWHIEKTSDGGGFKIILFHGEKFSRDLRRRLPAREAEASTRGDLSAASPKEPTAAATVEIDQGAIDEMGKRGIGETDARKFLAALGPGQPILDQLEYGDYQISRKRGKIANPPGFYISLLQRNVPVPAGFVSSRQAIKQQEELWRQRQAIQERQAAALAAEEAERQRLDAEIARLPEEARTALFEQAKAELLASHPGMAVFFQANPEGALDDGAVRARMRRLLAGGGADGPPRG